MRGSSGCCAAERVGRVVFGGGGTMKEFVYFITSEGGPIKIGRATDVQKRLSALQTSNPETLFVVGVIHSELHSESSVHRRFEHLRLRGEWFRRSSELITFIEENRNVTLIGGKIKIPKPQIVDPEKTPYGPVEVIEGEHMGKIGYYDDDEIELMEECEFCEQARHREISTGSYECEDCIWEKFAVVVFPPWSDGYYLLPHECLRRLDDEREHTKAFNVVRGLFPQIEAADVDLILETGEIMSPIHQKEIRRRETVKTLQEHFKIPDSDLPTEHERQCFQDAVAMLRKWKNEADAAKRND
jgi:hypothetical protein